MNAPTPITFVTLDGAERSFRLTNKRMLEIRRRMLAGFQNGDADYLWFACDDKDGLTEDDFIELLPMHDSELIQGLVNAIDKEWRSAKQPDARNDKFRPTKAETQQMNGSGSSDSGA